MRKATVTYINFRLLLRKVKSTAGHDYWRSCGLQVRVATLSPPGSETRIWMYGYGSDKNRHLA